MKSLNEDIKTGQFQSIYLLYGDENFLKKRYKNMLTEEIRGENDTINYNYFEGDKINVAEVIDLAETMPFFADTRLIVLENSGFFSGKGLELAEYLEEMPETTHIIFVEAQIDKRAKLYKAVQKKGRAVELATQDTKTLVMWIGRLFKEEKKQIKETTVHLLIEKVGEDMFRLQSEVNKLIDYTLGRDVITPEDIEAVCVTQVKNRIFYMVDAVAEKKQKNALECYYDLLALKEPPMHILFLLTRHFRILYQIKSMENSYYTNNEMSQKCGVPPFTIKKYNGQAKHFRMEELRTIVEEAVETEASIKTGVLSDKLAVELFIVKYSLA